MCLLDPQIKPPLSLLTFPFKRKDLVNELNALTNRSRSAIDLGAVGET